MSTVLQYRALVRELEETRALGEQVAPLLDAVLLAPDKPARDAALQASGKPCQELLRHLALVLAEGRQFLLDMGEQPFDLAGVQRAHGAFEAEFASYRYHHEAEELAPRLSLVLAALSELERQLGLVPVRRSG